MLSNETIQNSTLLRPKSKSSNRAPFVVPVKDSLSSSLWFNNNNNNNRHAASALSDKSKKSITILRPESIKRANNDACMAAAIGDLEWLKQSLKLSSEMAFDKNGLATIHLASIHCRMNILKYLIEELNVDSNFASMHGWRPIHLVISFKNGINAVDCLKYLIENGADVNVKNEDNVTPLHQAATEGHFECMKILLDNKADPFVLDYRNQLPMDLAKVWGHKKCAKLLTASMWHTEKLLTFKEEYLNKKLRTQDVLLEIERAHSILHQNKQKSTKKFDNWLNNQSFTKTNSKIAGSEPDLSRKPENIPIARKKLPKLKKSYDSDTDNETDVKGSRFVKPNDKKTRKNLHSAADSDASHSLYRSQEFNSEDLSKESENEEDVKTNWNYSTKVGDKQYVKNLDDFYPRDQYTRLPPDGDLLLLHHQLNGLTLDEIKDFMRKNIKEKTEILKTEQDKIEQTKIKSGKKKIQQSKTFSNKRPVYYKPRNVIDYETKARPQDEFSKLNVAAFTLNDDPTSYYYQESKKIIEKQKTEPVINKKRSVSFHKKKNDENGYKKIIENYFDNDLYDFMTTKNGKINPKYEKVFIC